LKSQQVYLQHIIESIARVEEYTAIGREEFLASHMAQDATLRQLQVMAESTKRLSEDLKSQHPEVDWRALAGFRNVLVHDYLGVDLYQVYENIQAQLPLLRTAVIALLKAF
jgi:uncharacterized protein with HEPN domain